MERQEIHDIYAAKGFDGELLDRVADKNHREPGALGLGNDGELQLQQVESRDVFRGAVVITIATLIGHLIPLLPFVVLPGTPALIVAIGLSATVGVTLGEIREIISIRDRGESRCPHIASGTAGPGRGV